MSDQPDIRVTDAGAPAGHVTVTVDGHDSIVPQNEAKAFVAAEIKEAQK